MTTDASAGLAGTFATMNAAATRQALASLMVKQQADGERAVVDLLQTALEQAPGPAAAPPGQGRLVDRQA